MVKTCHLAMALLATLSAACSPSTPAPIEYRLSTQMPTRTPTPAQAHASPQNQETLVASLSQTFGVHILGFPTTTSDTQPSRVPPTATPRPPMTATHSIGPQASVDHFDDEFCGI